MSHVFTSNPQDSASQRLTVEETRELIQFLQGRSSPSDGRLSVNEIAQALGIPPWEVQDAIRRMRTEKAHKTPLPERVWLKRKLWKWVLASVLALWVSCVMIAFSFHESRSGPVQPQFEHFAPPFVFPYNSEMISSGSAIGLKAPGGFSYYISVETSSAAVLGDQSDFRRLDSMSRTNVNLVQERLADDLVKGFDKLVKQSPEIWVVNGKAIAAMELNYYLGGNPISIDMTLDKAAFPYDPKNPKSREFRQDVLTQIERRWDEFTTVVN